ncbi:RHS repeat-associated core domain-containing protein [Paracoccus tegillarcae]|uniref:RHS repeat-associated core domain-containing protein n=1 Tax=Paracoccus tegillarcae TaxID=1529068 RepID=A0A2K9EPX9_9RHOB|nr:RHS repeat-associated core domain-containing protein [Paracoccus tegillarcae]AUH33705.1 hypothetical protein CUV01_10170 [Paracoccus tegillarcae]
MSFSQGATVGSTVSGGSFPVDSSGRSGTDPYDALAEEYALSASDQRWDAGLEFMEREDVGRVLTIGGVLLPAAQAGGAAWLIGGATAGGAGMAALTVGLPLAVGAYGAYRAAKFTSPYGEAAGHWFMQSDFMASRGYVPLPAPGEMPARKDHDIAHVNSGLSLGGILGAVVVGAVVAVAAGALIVATGGIAAVAIVGGLVAGGAAGGLVGGFASAVGQYGTNKGKIKDGSPNVYFENEPVARVGDEVDCQEHSKSAVAEGAETVFANNLPIARIGNKTTCDGTINDGIDSIVIDIDTSARSLPIDVGTANRIVRSTAIFLDIAPMPGGGPRKGDPSTARGGDLPNSCRSACGDPVDVATGQFIDLRTDILIPGTIPLQLDRCHSRTSQGIQGKGWSGTWAQHLRIEGETVTYQTPEGSLIVFHTPGDDVLSYNLRFPQLELLGRLSGDLFIHDRQAQLFYVFADEGGTVRRLARIEDRNGNRIRLIYGLDGLRRVEHSDGFALKIHSEGGLIQSALLDAADADGCAFFWTYTADGRLRESTSSQAGYMRYDYDGAGRITAWHDAKDTHVHYEYGPDDRIVKSWTDSGHMGVQIDYDLPRQRTVATTQDGAVTVYDWTGDGVVWRETDPLGHVWLTEWDRAFHITSLTNPLGGRVQFDHDAAGNMVRLVDADGATTQWHYSRDGLLQGTTDAGGNHTTYRRDASGNIVGATDPLGQVTTLGLGDKGQLLRIDLPGNVQQRIYYDPQLRPNRMRDPDGNETRMSHDTEGRLHWFTDAIGATTRYDVSRGAENPRGAIRRVELPDGAVSAVTWDIEGQLSSVTGPTGDTRHFRFGALDLPTETVDAKGHRIRLEHDREMRLSAVINEMGERYEYSYDKAGRLVGERDYSGLITRYSHDPVGRVIRKTAPDGTQTDYDYSAAGLLLTARIRRQGGDAVTRFAYDPRGLLIRAENDDATVEYDYDSLGRVVAERLNGREITSDYSVAGQRIARSGDVLHLTSGWTKAGLPTDLKIGDHAALSFSHDPRGFETMRQSPAGFALAQGHNIAGYLAEQIAGPLSRLPEEAHDGMLGRGRPVEIATRIGAQMHRSYDWDLAGRAIEVHDRTMGRAGFAYDNRGQVTRTRRDTAAGDTILSEFEYDPARNIMQVIQAGHRDAVASQAGRVRSRGKVLYEHDNCGRVIEKRVEEPGFRPRVWRMRWDGQGQLVGLETPEGQHWRYRYDPMGRRIARQTSDGTGYAYQWEGDLLIAEAPMTADGTVAWDQARNWVYEPGSLRPMAQIEDEALHYIVTDHLGTPREMFSEDGSAVPWRAELSLWGDIADLRRKAANDDAPPVDCPIRFQGQWYDEESGLHYNRFRYYDPEATQYLSPDPIGLAGGARPQGYVADPNGWVDPFGLRPCPRREVNGATIFGTGQKDKTPGHNQFSEVIANKLAMSGKFERIYMNRSYNLAEGPNVSRNRPDVMAVDRNGKVHAIELASKTDTGKRYGSLRSRNNDAMRGLTKTQRGLVIVLDHPYDARAMKFALDELIGTVP